jgi:tungstate transport system substrate-binding protein
MTPTGSTAASKVLAARCAASAALALLTLLVAAACTAVVPTPQPKPSPANPNVFLATTTSTQDTGLLEVLIPDFESRTGYRIKSIAVGTGAAIALGARGEADVLLVHAPSAERDFMTTGAGARRLAVMHNDFVLVGPHDDAAGIRGKPPVDALRAIAAGRVAFISRGDRSGTDILEKQLWRDTGSTPSGTWYVESGTGMGQTLRVASERGAYTLTDRGTYLANKAELALDILVEGHPALLNRYHVITVSRQRFPSVNAEGAEAFADYLVSSEAQRLIGDFGRERFGQPLFVPDAGKREEEPAN